MKTLLAWSNGLLIGYYIGISRDGFLRAWKEQREKSDTEETSHVAAEPRKS